LEGGGAGKCEHKGVVMKALVTGFDAFGGDKVNPSILAVRRLKRRMNGIAIHTVELPTSYARSPRRRSRRTRRPAPA